VSYSEYITGSDWSADAPAGSLFDFVDLVITNESVEPARFPFAALRLIDGKGAGASGESQNPGDRGPIFQSQFRAGLLNPGPGQIWSASVHLRGPDWDRPRRARELEQAVGAAGTLAATPSAGD
jgi:hypothetical protein